MALLRIQLLGGLRLEYGDAPVATVNTPRLQSLFAYLVLNRGAAQPRRHVAFLLWPDSTEAQALTNLRHVLHLLRHALPDADRFVRVEGHSVQWQPEAPAEIDVEDLEATRTPGAGIEDLRRAVDLYHGELLPSCYDEWIVAHRERLHADYVDALARLLQILEAERDYAGAIRYARRLLQADPLEEESYRLLMRLHALNDDRAAALHVYHSCVSVLQRELDVEPSATTRQLYERLLNLEQPPAPATPSRLPLIGRGSEWDRLKAEWHAAAGGPRLAIISGEPGIGKTRLAEELIEWAGRQDIVAAQAGCYAAGRALAYTPVVDWLRCVPLPPLNDVWLAEVARLLPELAEQRAHLPPPGPLSEDWQRQRLFEALSRAILGSGRPVLLVLDDLQWCDAETVQFLHYLLRLNQSGRLMVVATLRSDEPIDHRPPGELLADLRHENRFAEIALAPLSESDTLDLAANVMGVPLAPALALPLYRGSEGNPLFVVEMARAGLTRRMPSAIDTGHGAAHANLELPAKVREVILARLAQLSPAAGELVSLAAVVGREFSFQLLRDASGITEEVLVQALDELWQRRIVREQGTSSYDFGHERLREVAYAGLSQARRRLLHRQVAHALEALHAGNLDVISSQVADHYEQAGLPDRAVTYLQRAAGAARRLFAIGEAVSLIRRAIDVAARLPSPTHSEILPKLFEDLADLLHMTGSQEEARESLNRAAQILAPCADACADRARLWRKMAHSYVEELRYKEAAQALIEADAVLGRAPEGKDTGAAAWWHEWIQIRLDRMSWHYWQADWQAIAALADQVRPILEHGGSALQHAQFYQELVRMALRRDRYSVNDETLAWSGASLTLIRELQDEPETAAVEFTHGFALLWRGELQQARSYLEHSLALAERIGDDLLQLRCTAYLSIWARITDRPAEVERYATGCLALSDRFSSPYYQAVAAANQAWLAWRAGRLGRARAGARAALELLKPPPPPYPFEWLAHWPLLAMALAEDDLREALGHAQRMLDASQQRLPAALTAGLEQAIAFGDQDRTAAAREALSSALHLARELRYL